MSDEDQRCTDPEVLSHISIVSGRLEEIVAKNGTTLDFSEVVIAAQNHFRWSIPYTFKGETVEITFSAFYRDEEFSYSIGGWAPIASDSEFSAVETFRTDDVVEAYQKLEEYLQISEENFPDYLPPQKQWKEKRFSMPDFLKNVPPIWQIIREFELTSLSEKLSVRRIFYRLEESLELLYLGPTGQERVDIKDGRITNVDSTLVVGKPVTSQWTGGEVTTENEGAYVDYLLSTGVFPTEPNTRFDRIKGFEKELRELPWQEDLEAIYSSNGEWKE